MNTLRGEPQPMLNSKKRSAGRIEREGVLSGLARLNYDRAGELRDSCAIRPAKDDVLDALAASWTAARIARLDPALLRLRGAVDPGATDRHELPMTIYA